MKQIEFIPIIEKTMNDRLVNLYGRHLVDLYSKIEELYNNDWYKSKFKLPASPLLIELEEDDKGTFPYENADIKIMIFGRETNNWEDRHDFRKNKELYTEYGTYNFYLNNNDDILAEIKGKHTDEEGNDIEDETQVIYGLTDIYIRYLYGRKDDGSYYTSGKTPFTKWCYKIVETIKDNIPEKKIEFVWNNLYKIGNTNKESGHSRGATNSIIRNIEKDCFDVIKDEIEILKPDILLFTPLNEDKTIMEKFGVNEDAFITIDPDLPELKRIAIPGFKYAARTIHPSTQGTPKEVYNAYNKALIKDMLNYI